jgi:hypothetical protein
VEVKSLEVMLFLQKETCERWVEDYSKKVRKRDLPPFRLEHVIVKDLLKLEKVEFADRTDPKSVLLTKGSDAYAAVIHVDKLLRQKYGVTPAPRERLTWREQKERDLRKIERRNAARAARSVSPDEWW